MSSRKKPKQYLVQEDRCSVGPYWLVLAVWEGAPATIAMGTQDMGAAVMHAASMNAELLRFGSVNTRLRSMDWFPLADEMERVEVRRLAAS